MLDQLSSIVTELGAELLSWRLVGGSDGVWQGTQFKAKADEMAHQFLERRLNSLAPPIPVISEEDATGHNHLRPRRYFLIDPIDGTASYAGGFSGYVTQVALMENAHPVLAAVFAPALQLLYLAQAGQGATLDGKPLRVTPNDDARILIDNYPEPRGTARAIYDGLSCTGYVESGSIALKTCRIADGTANIFFKDVVVRDWDLAPAHLIVEEAGGTLTALDGGPMSYTGSFEKPGIIVTSTPGLAESALDWLAVPADKNGRQTL